MRAVRHARYGGPEVLELVEVPDPAPARGEVLVRVLAAALNPKDVLVRKGRFRALARAPLPRATGLDLCGEVIGLGPGVTRVRRGERIFAMLPGWTGGACAEQCLVPEATCATAPAALSDEEAAAIPLAALTALQALRDVARTRPHHRVLLLGASGGVGTFAIQLARELGGRVTTTSSAGNRDLCLGLGADEALDYRVDDPLAGAGLRGGSSGLAGRGAEGPLFDVIFDVFGNRSFGAARRALAPGGTYVTTVPSARIVVDTVRTLLGGRRARLVVVRARRADLEDLAARVAAGTLRPVIDRVFPLAEIAAAHAHLETRRARGKVVIRVA